VSYQGKHCFTGLGCEALNSLYHVHNGQDVILSATCQHGKGWEHVKDKWHEKDNQEYDLSPPFRGHFPDESGLARSTSVLFWKKIFVCDPQKELLQNTSYDV